MTATPIESEVEIDAPVEVVWRTITEPEQIAQWFAERVELDAVPGGRGYLVFEREGAEHIAPLVVEAVEAPERFSFRWCHPEGETPAAGNSTLVEFTLEGLAGERTRLRVTETELDLLDWATEDKASFAEEHQEGWTTLTRRLVALLADRPG
jgi:uncharacterized protein YndB with AHSA1/START domain